MLLETHIKLCMTELDFLRKKNIASKIGKMGQKKGSLSLLKTFAINF